MCFSYKATNCKDTTSKENEEKGRVLQIHVENEDKSQENRPRKRIRQQGWQTDDELANEEHGHNGCKICNNKLDIIQEKLHKVLSLIPEVEQLCARVKQLEEDKQNMHQSLEFTQTEVSVLKSQIKSTTEELAVAKGKIGKVDQ